MIFKGTTDPEVSAAEKEEEVSSLSVRYHIFVVKVKIQNVHCQKRLKVITDKVNIQTAWFRAKILKFRIG